MPAAEQYRQQAALLIRVFPFVAEEACFATKGGTAINLFVRNMPRLSVDIDLTYLRQHLPRYPEKARAAAERLAVQTGIGRKRRAAEVPKSRPVAELRTETGVNERAGEGAEKRIGSPRGTLLRKGFGETGLRPFLAVVNDY